MLTLYFVAGRPLELEDIGLDALLLGFEPQLCTYSKSGDFYLNVVYDRSRSWYGATKRPWFWNWRKIQELDLIDPDNPDPHPRPSLANACIYEIDFHAASASQLAKLLRRLMVRFEAVVWMSEFPTVHVDQLEKWAGEIASMKW